MGGYALEGAHAALKVTICKRTLNVVKRQSVQAPVTIRWMHRGSILSMVEVISIIDEI